MVFDRDASTLDWSESQLLLAPDGGSYDNFGYVVALDGEVLAVTAPGDVNNVTGSNSEVQGM